MQNTGIIDVLLVLFHFFGLPPPEHTGEVGGKAVTVELAQVRALWNDRWVAVKPNANVRVHFANDMIRTESQPFDLPKEATSTSESPPLDEEAVGKIEEAGDVSAEELPSNVRSTPPAPSPTTLTFYMSVRPSPTLPPLLILNETHMAIARVDGEGKSMEESLEVSAEQVEDSAELLPQAKEVEAPLVRAQTTTTAVPATKTAPRPTASAAAPTAPMEAEEPAVVEAPADGEKEKPKDGGRKLAELPPLRDHPHEAKPMIGAPSDVLVVPPFVSTTAPPPPPPSPPATTPASVESSIPPTAELSTLGKYLTGFPCVFRDCHPLLITTPPPRRVLKPPTITRRARRTEDEAEGAESSTSAPSTVQPTVKWSCRCGGKN
ncbi:hypothetical protein M3Y99_00623600 [Aphelenchoides fujianensis]|nr:hypothetical protein M3Y99_00623600 [Aphelenchoides fujianensis]